MRGLLLVVVYINLF